MTDNTFKLYINYRTICGMSAAVNSSPAHLYDDNHLIRNRNTNSLCHNSTYISIGFQLQSDCFFADREQWVEGGAEVTAVSVW